MLGPTGCLLLEVTSEMHCRYSPGAVRDLRCHWGIDRVTAGDHCGDTCRRSKARHGGATLEESFAHGTLVFRLTGATMSELPTFHGHIIELRRHVNVHWRHLHPIAPTDRWELWLCAPDGTERKFTVHTRDMPARRGHEVSLITTSHSRPRVLALANWTTIDGVNYARSEPPGLVRVGDVPWLAAGFIGMTAWLGDAGMALFVPAAAAVLAVVATVRWVVRQRLAWRVDRAIDLEAWRTAKEPPPLH